MIPPQDEWGLDPLYWSYVKLPVRHVHALEGIPDLPGTFIIPVSKRPVSKVQLVGTIVSIKLEGSNTLYALDDGTGLLQCTRFPRREDDGATALSNGEASQFSNAVLTAPVGEEFSLGEVVRVRGSLSSYQGCTEVKIVNIHRLPCCNTEALHWLEAVSLGRSVYRNPVAHDAPTATAIAARRCGVPTCACPEANEEEDEEEGQRRGHGWFEGGGNKRDGRGGSSQRHRRTLHYCACLATEELKRDPHLVFRFALLDYLSSLDSMSSSSSSISSSSSSFPSSSSSSSSSFCRVETLVSVPYAQLVAACGCSQMGLVSEEVSPHLSNVAFRVVEGGGDQASVAANPATALTPSGSWSVASASRATSSGAVLATASELRDRVRQLLRFTLLRLRGDGLLFHQDGSGNGGGDAYDFLDSKHFLSPLLRQCVLAATSATQATPAAVSATVGDGAIAIEGRTCAATAAGVAAASSSKPSTPSVTSPASSYSSVVLVLSRDVDKLRSHAVLLDPRVRNVPDSRLKLCFADLISSGEEITVVEPVGGHSGDSSSSSKGSRNEGFSLTDTGDEENHRTTTEKKRDERWRGGDQMTKRSGSPTDLKTTTRGNIGDLSGQCDGGLLSQKRPRNGETKEQTRTSEAQPPQAPKDTQPSDSEGFDNDLAEDKDDGDSLLDELLA